MSMTRNAARVAGALFAVLVLSGCGRDKSAQPPGEVNPFAGLPFVLAPGPTGELEPRDADGKPLPPSNTPPTEQIKAIRNLSQAAVLKIDGSCVYWIYIGGRWYQKPC